LISSICETPAFGRIIQLLPLAKRFWSSKLDESNIARVVEILRPKLRVMSLDEAIREVAGFIDHSLLRGAKEHIEREAARIRILRDPPAIEKEGLANWYGGPGKDDRYWPPVFGAIAEKWKGSPALKQLDAASTRVVADLGNPHLPRFSARGLVVGDVQSGKTSNFTATIAKAADAGYRFFLVMSGTKNKLRKQTQERLFSDLVRLDLSGWLLLTDARRDFGNGIPMPASQVFTQDSQQRALVVVKKHSGRLNYLLNWLKACDPDLLLRTPTLIIDDEADEASINTAQAKEERSKVNSAIVEIIRVLPRVSFVGYTATPYANFFIDASAPEDLYPRDFIINLPSSPEYFGYERIFGRERTRFDESDADIDGYDMVRSVPEKEANLLKPGKKDSVFKVDLKSLTSLVSAIDWFLMASAARVVRGQVSQHSSMLIHTSQLTRVHTTFRKPIEQLLKERRTALQKGDDELRKKFEEQWDAECARVPASEFSLAAVEFSAIWENLDAVLQRVKVVIENSMSADEERLVYGQEPGTFIAVGGDVLSRGLTLEGLVVSYFTRSASTYDTLMQMGRWFGFRPGYGDLPRIWMTDDLKSNFYRLGGLDREMRQLIEKSYSGHVTPEHFAPLIRIHPNLAVTSRMKMSHSDVEQMRLSYGSTRSQTILFSRDKTWLQTNIDAAAGLVSAALASGSKLEPSSLPRRHVLRNIDAALILKFLETYRFHEDSWSLNSEAICKYIRSERDARSLDLWNVVVVTGEGDGEQVELGGTRFQSVIRSRLNAPDIPYANIKSLMSEDDALADMALADGRPEDIEAIIEARNKEMTRIGLLVLYPIDRTSPPRSPKKRKVGELVRIPLDSPLPVIGVGLVFPKSERSDSQSGVYVTQRLPREEVEVPEDVFDDDDVQVAQ
jgi:hypothetical protein